MCSKGCNSSRRMLASLAYRRVQSAIRRAAARRRRTGRGVPGLDLDDRARQPFPALWAFGPWRRRRCDRAPRRALLGTDQLRPWLSWAPQHPSHPERVPEVSVAPMGASSQGGSRRETPDDGRPAAGAMLSSSSYRERSREVGGRRLHQQHMRVSAAF